MRKSFQQQLCDAIAIIKGMYQVGVRCCHGQGRLWLLHVPGVELTLISQSVLFSFEGMFSKISSHLREFWLRLFMLTLNVPKNTTTQ